MGKYDKLRQKILAGGSDGNINFQQLCQLLRRLGFEERIRGSHHIFTREGIDEIINLQPKASRSGVSWSHTTWENPMSVKYELVIYWSDDDQSFVVEVPELPGCMADGETYEQAVTNAQQVIREWIDTAVELGRPIPEPKGRLMYA